MQFIWSKKLLFWNIVALVLIKATLSFSVFQLANLLDGVPIFTKEEVIRETNAVRTGAQVRTLRENEALSVAAAQKLDDMVRNQYFAHVSPTGVSPWEWFQRNRYAYSIAGENLAMGFLDAATTVRAWNQSLTHRANMTDSRYSEIGVAVARGTIQGIDGFIVVQLFASPATTKVSLGLSGSQAQEETPFPGGVPPSPTPLAQPTAKRAPFVYAGAGDAPRVTSVASYPPRFSGLVRVVERSYVIYAFLIAMFMLVYLIFIETSRTRMLHAAGQAAIVAAAIAIPLLELSRIALIL